MEHYRLILDNSGADHCLYGTGRAMLVSAFTSTNKPESAKRTAFLRSTRAANTGTVLIFLLKGFGWHPCWIYRQRYSDASGVPTSTMQYQSYEYEWILSDAWSARHLAAASNGGEA